MEERQPEHSSSPAPGSPVSGVVVGCSVVHKRFALPKLIDPAKMTVGHDAPALQENQRGHSVGQPA